MRTGKKVTADLPDDIAIGPEQARCMSICRLRQSRTGLILEIRDDGVGMPEVTIGRPASVGIVGMQERAALIGAKLTISSRPGRGTTVLLSVPPLHKAQGA